MKTYIVLDESGAMHLKQERYFVIAGFITRELHKVTSSHINDSQQALFLNELYSLM